MEDRCLVTDKQHIIFMLYITLLLHSLQSPPLFTVTQKNLNKNMTKIIQNVQFTDYF